jgi:hypothetical protein
MDPVKREQMAMSDDLSKAIPFVVGAVWAIAVAVGGILVAAFSKLTGENASKTASG